MQSVEAVDWPSDLLHPNHPDFEKAAIKWLLTLLPSSAAPSMVAKRHLDVLLHLAHGTLTGVLEGLRESYANARVALSDHHPPEVIAASLAAIADMGKAVARDLAVVALIQELRQG